MAILRGFLVSLLAGFVVVSFGNADKADQWEELSPTDQTALESPLFIESSSGGRHRIGLHQQRLVQMYDQLTAQGHVTVTNFLPRASHQDPEHPGPITFQLVDVFTEDAILEQANEDGTTTILELPKMVHLHGSIKGDPDSLVLLNIAPSGSIGLVHTSKVQYSVENDPTGHSILAAAGDGNSKLEEMDKYAARQEQAEVDEMPVPEDDSQMLATVLNVPQGEETLAAAQANKYTINVAIDCDQACVARLNRYAPSSGIGTDAKSYLAALMAGVSVLYERDLGRALKISYLKLWNTASPFNSGTRSLTQYREYWNKSPPTKDYDVAHLMTGIQEGGVAYLKTVCRKSYNVGVSSLRGQWKGSNAATAYNWDLEVTAHELGHNFGSGHSHDYSPPIDECVSCKAGFTDSQCKSGGSNVGPVARGSSKCVRGSIMSYCHLCGGVKNLNMRFHPRARKVIQDTLKKNCGPAGPRPGGPAPPPTPAPAPKTCSSKNTGGTCWFSKCYGWRNAKCSYPRCKCTGNTCAKNGKCVVL